jgi:hypothetical protein
MKIEDRFLSSKITHNAGDFRGILWENWEVVINFLEGETPKLVAKTFKRECATEKEAKKLEAKALSIIKLAVKDPKNKFFKNGEEVRITIPTLEEVETIESTENTKTKDLYRILGKTLTLSRILTSLEPYPNNYGLIAGNISKINRKEGSYKFLCKWDLEKETLEEQSEETQKTIYELLTME